MDDTNGELQAIKGRAIGKVQEILQAYSAIDKAIWDAQKHMGELLATLRGMQAKVQRSTKEAEKDLVFLLKVKNETEH